MGYAVRFENVYKEYPFYQHITAGFKSFLFHLTENIASLKKTRFIALNEVSFQVEKGETFGIIGRNGSGKSTILGLVAGVMKPDRGSVRTFGKISSLLELGAGFHPDLSGIENIVMNGILAGNTREEMLKKMGAIVDFSELGEFIYQPLRTYSSGMQMRLGFAVAVHIDPEILLIDEALAAGDASFQEKCKEKMMEFKKSGATILLVSHDMPAIAKLCDRAVWIDGGKVMETGEPIGVIKGYLGHLGQPVAFDLEEPEETTEEETAEIEAEGDEHVIIRDSEEPAAPESEPAASEPAPEGPSQPVSAASWWDSPVILRASEAIITGDRDISVYEFLKEEYAISGLKKGLSVRTRLSGLEENFVQYDTCASFDILDEPEDIERVLAGEWEFKGNSYDLLLCVDVLSRTGRIEGLLKDLAGVLKDGGVLLALEYVGPAGLRWSDQELHIAETIMRAFDNTEIGDQEVDPVSAQVPQLDAAIESAVMSGNIIPSLEEIFDILSVRYFAGPLHDLVLDKVLGGLDQTNGKDRATIRMILECERVLAEKGVVQGKYALVIGRKRPS